VLTCVRILLILSRFLFQHPAPPAIYTLSLHDALPILPVLRLDAPLIVFRTHLLELPTSDETIHEHLFKQLPLPKIFGRAVHALRSEEHTSELQSRFDLVCRLLLEKKKKKTRESRTNST